METFFMKLSTWFIILLASVQIHGYEGCLEKERRALLEIKSFFISVREMEIADDILKSWVDDLKSDCCGWEQVKCNATTGRLIKLSLDNTRQYSSTVSGDGFPLLNLSLFFPFEDLQSLDLSSNYFDGFYENKGSDGFGSLKKLKILNLGYNYLNDSILPYLASLTSLQTLNLTSNSIEGVFRSKPGLGNLTKLEMLDLSGNVITGSLSCQGLEDLKSLKLLDLSENNVNGSLASQGFCELKNLVELDLSRNNFDGNLPLCVSNLTNLKVLDLSSNQLSGNLAYVIANLTSLEYISLSDNKFQGLFSFSLLVNHSNLQVLQLSSNLLQVKNEKLPSFPTYQLKVLNLKNCSLHAIPSFLLYQYDLRFIDLSHNKLVGSFPTWLLQNNTKLETLYLMNNSLSGILQLPNFKHELLHLDISINNFSGQLRSNVGKILWKLVSMKISDNSFEGNLPSSMSEMKRLETLDLSSNNFSGVLPRQFFTGCPSLSSLTLSDNNFQGQVFPKYMNFSNLQFVYVNNNNFSGKIGDGLSKATSLFILDISNNRLSGEIPHWLGNFTHLWILLMSNNSLEGNIPVQLSNLKILNVLDISENRLFGSMPSFLNLSLLEHLYLHKNGFNGSISYAVARSSALQTLDLRDNQFSGSIPNWIHELSNLRILLLRGNHLVGHIPNRLCQLDELSILDLSYNKLNGAIPACLTNMTALKMREYELSLFTLVDTTYSCSPFFDNYYKSTLVLRQWETIYQLSGQRQVEFMTKNRYEPYLGYVLNYMTGIDLSCNELTGDIPAEIGQLHEIRALNLSHNFLSGPIPGSFSNLSMIESLDLSHNELSGQIPPQLTDLNYLSDFNLSYNNLSGPTPNTGQFATFDESNYGGNPGLCGPTISKSCVRGVEVPIKPPSGAKEDEYAIDMVAFYWSFLASCVTFILSLFAILCLNSYWRMVWFHFIDAFIDSCYYWLFNVSYRRS